VTSTEERDRMITTPPLDEPLADRGDFMEIMCVPSGSWRGGWDICLRIDGTYTCESDARAMAEFWSERLVVPLAREAAARRTS
jgi:hypothetical protein